MTAIPPMNLPAPGMPWGRWVQNAITALQTSISRQGNDGSVANSRLNSSLNALAQQIVNLNNKFNAAMANVSVKAANVTAGTFVAGVLLPAGQISGTVPASQVGSIPTSQLTGDYTTANVTGTNSVTGNNVYATQGPSQNITATRVAGWLQSSNGLIGTASSSLRYKTNVVPAVTDPEALLALVVHYYNYKAEVARRDDPTSPDYVGPDYHVHQEIGGIAEEFHAAGLWEFVVYARNDDGTLALDDAGQPVPDGLHYELIGLGALIAAQHVNKKLNDLAARVAKLDGGPTTA